MKLEEKQKPEWSIRRVLTAVRALGLQCGYNRATGEFRISPARGWPDEVYYTPDRNNAVETARVIRQRDERALGCATLLVKGDVEGVQDALCARGFHPTDWMTQPVAVRVGRRPYTTCLVDVSVACLPGVERWFEEYSTPLDDTPFPTGTLIQYTRKRPGGRTP